MANYRYFNGGSNSGSYCVCVEDEIIFNSASHAERHYGISRGTISKSIKNNGGIVGKKTFSWFKRSEHSEYRTPQQVSAEKGRRR